MSQMNFSGRKNMRRINALAYLKDQLDTGYKPISHKIGLTDSVQLIWPAGTKDKSLDNAIGIIHTDADKTRMQKEIKALESKIVTPEVAASIRTKKYRGGGR